MAFTSDIRVYESSLTDGNSWISALSVQKDCLLKNPCTKCWKKSQANLTLAPLALNVPCELFCSHIKMSCNDFPHLCCWFIAHEKVVCQCRKKIKPTLNRDNDKGVQNETEGERKLFRKWMGKLSLKFLSKSHESISRQCWFIVSPFIEMNLVNRNCYLISFIPIFSSALWVQTLDGFNVRPYRSKHTKVEIVVTTPTDHFSVSKVMKVMRFIREIARDYMIVVYCSPVSNMITQNGIIVVFNDDNRYTYSMRGGSVFPLFSWNE